MRPNCKFSSEVTAENRSEDLENQSILSLLRVQRPLVMPFSTAGEPAESED
jgi:hypothetical protein